MSAGLVAAAPPRAVPPTVARPLSVWAPNAVAVEVLRFEAGADQDAAPIESRPMDASSDGWWAAEIEAAAGEEYLFAVHTDSEVLHRIDPWARQVTSSVGRAVFTSAYTAWTDEGFRARPLNEWVIYELHPGTFGPGGLDQAADRLEDLADLGITAVELMPVAEFAGDVSWGYNPSLPFAVESAYGGPDALSRFVDRAHRLGMAVIADVVYNHLGPSDLDLWRFDGWSSDDGGGIWFYNDWRAETPWGATRPDYGRPEVRRYLTDNAVMWLTEFHLDGLRLDSTINIRNAHGHLADDGDLPDGRSLLQEITAAAHSVAPGCVLIAEDLQDDPAVVGDPADGGLGFDLQWAADFVHPVRAALEAADDAERDPGAITAAAVGSGPEAWRRVVYTESHDEVANGRTRVPAEIDPDDPHALHAVRRSALGAVLMMASAGVPMLFQGQEWSATDWFDDQRPLDWESRLERAGTVSMWRDLIRLRTGADDRAPGLRGDQIEAHCTGSAVVLRRWGIGGPEQATVVVCNLGAEPVTVPSLVADDGRYGVVFASDFDGYHPTGESRSSLQGTDAHVDSYGALILAPS